MEVVLLCLRASSGGDRVVVGACGQRLHLPASWAFTVLRKDGREVKSGDDIAANEEHVGRVTSTTAVAAAYEPASGDHAVREFTVNVQRGRGMDMHERMQVC